MLLAALLGAVTVAGCPHDPSLGSVTFVRNGALHRVSLADCADRIVGRAPRTSALPHVRTPGDGVIYATSRWPHKPYRQALWLKLPDGRRIRLTPDLPGDQLPEPLSLSPDGRYVFWRDFILHSDSIAADGSPLEVTRVVHEGRTREVTGGMLAYADYLTWCGQKLVFVAGGDRLATHNKRLVVAQGHEWRPRSLWGPPGRAVGSVACAPDGRSVVVLSQQDSADYTFLRPHWQLWRVGLDGSHALLDAPPPGWADESPRWARDGRALFFVRERKSRGFLMVLRGHTVTGPIARLGLDVGFYDHHDWWARP